MYNSNHGYIRPDFMSENGPDSFAWLNDRPARMHGKLIWPSCKKVSEHIFSL
jgi:hypothetical protein